MSEMKRSRVFILGAGCSAKCGYPLGIGLTDQLQQFYWELLNDCARIKQSVSDTINLMKGVPSIETLDQLAKHLEEECGAHRQTEKQTDQQILNAKIATSAMFVAREEAAKKVDLQGYLNLIASIFGGDPWQIGIEMSNAHVLSFNYDRLFEISFQRYFAHFDPERFGLYSDAVLNSGFKRGNGYRYEMVQVGDNRFCFLKLHGSAGWWVRLRSGNKAKDECRLYCPACPERLNEPNLEKIEELLQKNEGCLKPWEPLIAFPHEKHRAVKGETEFLADPYLEKIEACAARVLASSTEVRIIGYSFAPIDSRHVVDNLLNKIPDGASIAVQNKDIATVKSRLEAYPALRGRVEFDPTPF